MLKEDFGWLECARCGKRVRWDDSFCSACGSKIELAEDATIVLPCLSETVGKRELWQFPSKVKSDAVVERNKLKSESNDLQDDEKTSDRIETTELRAEPDDLQDDEESDYADDEIETSEEETESNDVEESSEEYVGLFDENWRESWLKYYRVDQKRSIYLLAFVIAELLAFWPYFFAVLYVFHYETFCECLTLSSAAVLLTHGVCVCVSYYSIFNLPNESSFAEVAKAVEKTRKRLVVGVWFISVFLLAFFACMIYNHSAEASANPVYTPVSFDD